MCMRFKFGIHFSSFHCVEIGQDRRILLYSPPPNGGGQLSAAAQFPNSATSHVKIHCYVLHGRGQENYKKDGRVSKSVVYIKETYKNNEPPFHRPLNF
jgi:hypothetical protein